MTHWNSPENTRVSSLFQKKALQFLLDDAEPQAAALQQHGFILEVWPDLLQSTFLLQGTSKPQHWALNQDRMEPSSTPKLQTFMSRWSGCTTVTIATIWTSPFSEQNTETVLWCFVGIKILAGCEMLKSLDFEWMLMKMFHPWNLLMAPWTLWTQARDWHREERRTHSFIHLIPAKTCQFFLLSKHLHQVAKTWTSPQVDCSASTTLLESTLIGFRGTLWVQETLLSERLRKSWKVRGALARSMRDVKVLKGEFGFRTWFQLFSFLINKTSERIKCQKQNSSSGNKRRLCCICVCPCMCAHMRAYVSAHRVCAREHTVSTTYKQQPYPTHTRDT